MTSRPLGVLWIGSPHSTNVPLSEMQEGACTVVRSSATDAVKCIAAYSPDIVAIEESPLTHDSLVLCSRLSRSTPTPVVIVSESADEEIIVEAFKAEAVDYLLLPLRPEELRARLAAVARRYRSLSPQIDNGCLTIGGLRVYPRERRVSLDSRELQLTATEFQLLLCLARAAGNPVSHDQLLEAVWGPEYVDCRHYLRLYIRYLREKIEAQPDQPELIVNAWGIGYKLNTETAPHTRI
jgi:two-component system KDP operon response regulator KdpE